MKPAAILADSTIGIVSPSSGVTDPDLVEKGCQRLTSHGLRVLRPSSGSPYGYLAAPDKVRIEVFNSFLRNHEPDALFCTRGGYGALRLLPFLDYEAAKRHPKLLVGYSDITALHLALFHKSGWTGISGSMVGVEWATSCEIVESMFWDLAAGAVWEDIKGPRGEPLQAFHEGVATGNLIGGNLSLLVRLIGTPYLPPLQGAILFLEDVGEKPYRIDGLLAQLQLSGILDHLGGLILGSFTDTATEKNTLSIPHLLEHYFGNAPYPVALGLRYGHYPVKTPMPVGIQAQLEVKGHKAQLRMLEPVVSSSPS